MQTATTVSDLRRHVDAWRAAGERIGFVPTMGFLHAGHVSLMQRARQECDVVVASIFVNPTQFGPNEDFDRYPRDDAGDRATCEAAGVDVLFIPTASAMYPDSPSVFVIVEGISDILEGAVRPGHYRGVATVVTKLFHLVKPHKAFFGQKDYQQCSVIKRMVKGLDMDVDVVVLPTVRERDGLAMSSRNSYLSTDERHTAAAIYRALSAAEQLAKTGTRQPEALKNKIQAVVREEKGIEIDYLEIADPESLAPLASAQDGMVLLIAVRIGRTRLIDNLVIQR